MIRFPSPRPVRLAQQICRLAGVSYLMIGVAVVGSLVMAPSAGNAMAGHTLFDVKDGVWASSTLWWDGIFNPLFHGMVFFALAGALGYVVEVGELLMDREYETPDEPIVPPVKPVTFDDGVPTLTRDDLQPRS